MISGCSFPAEISSLLFVSLLLIPIAPPAVFDVFLAIVGGPSMSWSIPSNGVQAHLLVGHGLGLGEKEAGSLPLLDAAMSSFLLNGSWYLERLKSSKLAAVSVEGPYNKRRLILCLLM